LNIRFRSHFSRASRYQPFSSFQYGLLALIYSHRSSRRRLHQLHCHAISPLTRIVAGQPFTISYAASPPALSPPPRQLRQPLPQIAAFTAPPFRHAASRYHAIEPFSIRSPVFTPFIFDYYTLIAFHIQADILGCAAFHVATAMPLYFRCHFRLRCVAFERRLADLAEY
jgi:hypothetical protein